MTALGLPYPTIIGIVGGGEWASTVLDRVTADGRYGVRLGQTAARRRGRAASGDRRGVRRRPVPARPPGDDRDHRRPVRVGPRRVGPPAAGRAGGDGRGRHRPPADAPRRAVRGGHADVHQRRRDAVRHLRAGRRQGRAQRRRARPARRGRGVRARPRGVGRARADRESRRSHAGTCRPVEPARSATPSDLHEPAERVGQPHLLGRPGAHPEQVGRGDERWPRSGPARSRR